MPLPTEPPRLSFADPDSFAALTLRERLPKILDLVAPAFREDPAFQRRLADLRRSLPAGSPPERLGTDEVERGFWDDFMRQYRGASWSSLPFFEGEFIFYRAILDAIDHRGGSARDPFCTGKSEALERAVLLLPRAARDSAELDAWDLPSLRRATEWALLGNAADLSHLTARLAGGRRPLIDDLAVFFDEVSREPRGNVEFVLDNAGEELIGDLVLVSYLLRALPQVTLRVHAKPAPIFVSDVTPHDWVSTLDRLCAHGMPEVASFGKQLREFERSGRLLVSTDAFWARPLCFLQMTGTLREQFGRATATIIKGDLNYRRYVQDRAWPLDSPTARHRVAELAPVLALRVLKSELVVGLPSAASANLRANEPDALYSGRNSLIQYFR